jgi:hypothetical protein
VSAAVQQIRRGYYDQNSPHDLTRHKLDLVSLVSETLLEEQVCMLNCTDLEPCTNVQYYVIEGEEANRCRQYVPYTIKMLIRHFLDKRQKLDLVSFTWRN